MRPGDIVRFKTDKETERREVTAVSDYTDWAEVEGGWLPMDHLILVETKKDAIDEQVDWLFS